MAGRSEFPGFMNYSNQGRNQNPVQTPNRDRPALPVDLTTLPAEELAALVERSHLSNTPINLAAFASCRASERHRAEEARHQREVGAIEAERPADRTDLVAHIAEFFDRIAQLERDCPAAHAGSAPSSGTRSSASETSLRFADPLVDRGRSDKSQGKQPTSDTATARAPPRPLPGVNQALP